MTKYRFEPFDVKRAMAGEKVFYQGREVVFGGHNPKATPSMQVLVWLNEGEFEAFYSDGRLYMSSGENETLFIGVEIKERENADIIRAYADGNSIEWRRKSDDNSLPWFGFEREDSPTIGHTGYDWRIKP